MCVFLAQHRRTLTFCSETNLSIRPNPWGGGGGGRIGDTEGEESLPKSLILSFFLANFGSSIRMFPNVSRMHSYVTRMYSYVSRMLRVWYPYVLVCIPMLPGCTRMSLVCHPCGVLVTINSNSVTNSFLFPLVGTVSSPIRLILLSGGFFSHFIFTPKQVVLNRVDRNGMHRRTYAS